MKSRMNEDGRKQLELQAKNLEALVAIASGFQPPKSQILEMADQMRAEGKAVPTYTTTTASMICKFNNKKAYIGNVKKDNISVNNGAVIELQDDQYLITKKLSDLLVDEKNLEEVHATIGGVDHKGIAILVNGADAAAKEESDRRKNQHRK
jgi:hypothetical protein